MANPYRRGTPDMYYEGPKAVLWAEYKFTKNKTVFAPRKALTAQQERWLRRAYEHRIPVCMIVGMSVKGFYYGFLLTGTRWCTTKVILADEPWHHPKGIAKIIEGLVT